MRLSTASFFAVAVAPAVLAAPVRRSVDNGTLTVVQFADVLEKLETGFYTQALQKFQASDFTSAGFTNPNIPIEQFTAIQSDEATHVTALESLLTSFGATPLDCKFDFSSVLTDVTTMVPVARLVENVGVGAYAGAAQLIGDKSVLTDAASILPIEARHQTILNVLSGATAIPQAFDIPLLPNEVLAIAGPFISGCDTGITPNAALTVTNTGPVLPGTSLTFSSPAINGSTDGFHCQMLVGGLPFSISLPIDQCVVPEGINGPVALFVTSDDQALNGNAAHRASNAIVAGPTMAFIDSQPDSLSQLVFNKNGTNGAPPPSTSTQTLPPAQASALLSSIAASSSPSPSPTPANNDSNNPSNSGKGAIADGISMIPAPAATVPPSTS